MKGLIGRRVNWNLTPIPWYLSFDKAVSPRLQAVDHQRLRSQKRFSKLTIRSFCQ